MDFAGIVQIFFFKVRQKHNGHGILLIRARSIYSTLVRIMFVGREVPVLPIFPLFLGNNIHVYTIFIQEVNYQIDIMSCILDEHKISFKHSQQAIVTSLV